MKKLTLSLILVAICGFVNATNAVEMPKVGKEATTLIVKSGKHNEIKPPEKVNYMYCVYFSNGGCCGAGETPEEALIALCITLYDSQHCP